MNITNYNTGAIHNAAAKFYEAKWYIYKYAMRATARPCEPTILIAYHVILNSDKWQAASREYFLREPKSNIMLAVKGL